MLPVGTHIVHMKLDGELRSAEASEAMGLKEAGSHWVSRVGDVKNCDGRIASEVQLAGEAE